MDWDDLRYIVAVADNGSAVGGAEKLGVNATTVQRRITKFEQEHGVRLFERRQSGFAPTPECTALVEASRPIEESISGITRDILARDSRLEGRLSVTTVDTLMYTVLAGHFARFQEQHPAIRLEITLTNSPLDLSRQDSDIAIRASNNPPENLVGQRIATWAMGIYATEETAGKIRDPDRLAELRNQPWVAPGEALRPSLAYGWVEKNVPQSSIVMSVDTFMGISVALATGCGIGIVPIVIGDSNPKLQRVGNPLEGLATSIWALTHPEIRSAAKIRAFMDFFTKAVRADSASFEGTQ